MNDKFQSEVLPLLPLKEMIVFPGAITPLFVVRPVSLLALEAALAGDKRVFLTCQRDGAVEEPGPADVFQTGVVGEILQVLRTPDGASKILVEGQYAARSVQVTGGDGELLTAFVGKVQAAAGDAATIAAHQRQALAAFERHAELSDKIPADLLGSIRNIAEPLGLLHAIANYAALRVEHKQEILEADALEEKYILLNQHLDAENQLLELENKIAGQVKSQIGRSQREYYLNEQLKAIENELGMGPQEDPELAELAAAIDASGMPEDARDKAEKELGRLSRMSPISPEAGITRTYIEWLTDMPWKKAPEDEIDLARARRVLDEDHHGLKKIKERILEYLAVVKLAGQGRGPILCFVGPPGVGKTSLGASIARCVGRKFVRISLGGVRDEAEIRGHRRTYVGAMPGKVVQSMKRAGATNPVFLLDEIDKMSSDFRGDPSSALLEVLDPQQNKAFVDHYLEVDYDLSRVMFIATANSTDAIPYPLLDRMEIIRLPGYTDAEKLEIARKHLLPRQRREHGLKATQLRLPKAAMLQAIGGHTREAGVRSLDRVIAQVCRKVAVQVVAGTPPPATVTPERLREYLGVAPYRDAGGERVAETGLCLGLAWTEAGGELLPVEVTLMAGKGMLTLTGKLGEVMQESAKTALSWIRSRARLLGIDPEFHSQLDIHVHIPEGAIPKDGPSAGVTLATAMASALAGIPVRQDLAMTGEVTLRGRVLRIGGLKEKLLAAQRRKVKVVLVPRDNEEELAEILPEVGKGVDVRPVETMEQVLDAALVRKPRPLAEPRPAARGRSQPRAV